MQCVCVCICVCICADLNCIRADAFSFLYFCVRVSVCSWLYVCVAGSDRPRL